MTRSTRRLPLLGVALLLVPFSALAADGPKPITWLSYVQSQPGKGQPLADHIAEGGKKSYDALMADGQILTWGVAMPIVHRADDDWNVLEWVTFRDWAAVDTFIGGFMAAEMSKSPEQRQADQEKWYSLIEAGSHHDEIIRHRVLARGADGERPGYYLLSYFPVKLGQADALQELWAASAKPALDELQSAGTIGAFGMALTEVHDGTGSNAIFWTAFPNLGAQDAVDAAFAAADAARGEEAQKELMAKFAATVDFDGHHDRLLAVVHFGGGSSSEASE